MLRHAVWPICILLLCCSGGSEDEQKSVDRQSLLQHYASKVIVPSYQSANTAATAFVDEAANFCKAPSEALLTSVRNAWLAAHSAWEKTAVHGFGPVVDLRLDNKIDFWPLRKDKIENFYAKTDMITADAIDKQGALVRGFAVAEYLLYRDSAGDAVELADYQDSKRCDFLFAVAMVLKRDIAEVSTAWDPEGEDFSHLFVTAGKGSAEYPKQQQALDALVNTMIAAVQNWESMKLSKPLGRQSGGEAAPQLVESPEAEKSKELLIANLEGFRAAFLGGAEQQPESLAAVLAADDAELVKKIDKAASDAISALKAMETSLKVAVVEKPEAPEAAFNQLKELLQALAVDMAGKLGVTPTFSDNDGD